MNETTQIKQLQEEIESLKKENKNLVKDCTALANRCYAQISNPVDRIVCKHCFMHSFTCPFKEQQEEKPKLSNKELKNVRKRFMMVATRIHQITLLVSEICSIPYKIAFKLVLATDTGKHIMEANEIELYEQVTANVYSIGVNLSESDTISTLYKGFATPLMDMEKIVEAYMKHNFTEGENKNE